MASPVPSSLPSPISGKTTMKSPSTFTRRTMADLSPSRSVAAPPLLLLLILPLLLCAATLPTAAAAGDSGRRGLLGFFYTRARGRCTPLYWSSTTREQWPKMVPPASTVWKAFGSRALEQRYGSGLTLSESAVAGEEAGAFGRLLKQGTAALLNSYARRGYPYRAWEVKSLMIEATVSEEAAAAQARLFAIANEACS